MSEEYTVNQGGYHSYQNMVATVNTALSDLEKICEEMRMEENKKDLIKLRKKLAEHRFAVGVMGEFKRGKSTVINSLLEQEVMPADILPCSATMNRVTYDLRPHVVLNMRDGSQKDIPVEELASYVTKLTGENESRAADVDEAVVYYPCRFCQNGVDIVDTPGLNDDERMNKISEEVIPKLDAVIMVITPDNPFSMSEAEFVRSKLMTSDLSRLIFLVNKIDQVRKKSDRPRVVEGIRQKIQKSVLEKTAAVYGPDSKEYEEAEKKLGDIRIYPISALDALEGKMDGDAEMIQRSGTLEFEAALTQMLTVERGALELSSPLNAIQRTSVDLAKTVNTRKSALNLSAQEFAESQNEALAQIKDMRAKKQQEKNRLKISASEVTAQMEQMVGQMYPELRKKLWNVVAQEADSISLDSLKNQAGQNAAAAQLQKAVSDAMQQEMTIMSEKLQGRIREYVGKEAVQMGTFFDTISKQIDQLQIDLTQNKLIDSADLVGTGIDALACFGAAAASNMAAFLGIGGIMAGYKNAGLKGAVVGGGISIAATWATALLLAASPIGIVGLPYVLISAAAGTAAGKFATGAIFKGDIAKKKLDEIKATMNKGIDDMIQNIQNSRELERWASDLVEQNFDALIEGLEEECERVLRDTESSINAIKQDLMENEMHRQQMEERCDKAMESVRKINETLNPIAIRVREVLEQPEKGAVNV